MSLADRLQEQSTRQPAPCVIGQLLETGAMNEVDQQTLRNALVNEAVTSTAIVRALAAEGYDVARTSLVRHRMNECSCRRLG